MRLVVPTPLDTSAEARLTQIVQNALGHPFTIRFTYVDNELPRTPNGKFEEFVCLVTRFVAWRRRSIPFS